jgi:uncharacterized protein (DUF305 family)
MKTLYVVLAAMAFGVPACGGGEDENARGERTSSTASVPFDRAFIDAMVPHHQVAIEMAREAKRAGLSQPDLLAIVRNIIATQRAEISQMIGWRKQWYGPGPRESEDRALAVLRLSAEEGGMAQHGGDFSDTEDVDHAFALMMIAHHRGAIEMARLARERAAHQEIRDLAVAIIAAQNLEIEAMHPHAEEKHH